MGVKKNRREFSRQLDPKIARKMEASGVLIANAAKSEIVRMGVVDTGRTLASVDYKVQRTTSRMGDGVTVRVGTPVRYARFPHSGTRHVVARPWLITGANKARDGLRRVWES